MTRQVVCPVALHPDGAPLRLPIFEHPKAGIQLVKGGLQAGERPKAGAARELFEESGLETRAALYLGNSDAIVSGEIWHFSMCRLVPPVRAHWQHLCADDGGNLFKFQWLDLTGPLPDMHISFRNAVDWIKAAL